MAIDVEFAETPVPRTSFRRPGSPYRQRIAAVALVTLMLSLGGLSNPGLADFFSPGQIALAWLEHVAELAIVAAVLVVVFTVVDANLPRTWPVRLAAVSAALLAAAAGVSTLLHVYYAGGVEHLPPVLRIAADTLRFGLPAVFLALAADLHRRALVMDTAAEALNVARAKLKQSESEQQLALLQAQVEPHFLFNMLANVRRLYRTAPRSGAEAVDALIRYLRMALPQLRTPHASLGDEIALVHAYVELFRVRMGTHLDAVVDVDPALNDAEFPPMLAMTLVENAIKHGLAPLGGGRLEVRARLRRQGLELSVSDDGAGFGTAAATGTGVGLANVRRQLAARYGERGRLTLSVRHPRGAQATIVVPYRRHVATVSSGEASG